MQWRLEVFFLVELLTEIEMQTDQLIREHELRQRDLMIVRYDRQRLLCDEIIGKQKVLINGNIISEPSGQTFPMSHFALWALIATNVYFVLRAFVHRVVFRNAAAKSSKW